MIFSSRNPGRIAIYLLFHLYNVYSSPVSPSYIGSWSYDCTACISVSIDNQTYLAAGVGSYLVLYMIGPKGRLVEKSRLFLKSKIIALSNDDKYLYLYTENKQFQIVRLNNTNLHEIASVSLEKHIQFQGNSICKYAHSIIIGGSYIFVVIDISDPVKPKLLFTTKYDPGLNVNAMMVAGDTIYASTSRAFRISITDSAWPSINIPVIGLKQENICRFGNTIYSYDNATTLTVRERSGLHNRDTTYTLKLPYRLMNLAGIHQNYFIMHKTHKQIYIMERNSEDFLVCCDTINVPAITNSIVSWKNFIFRANRFSGIELYDGRKTPWIKSSSPDSLRYGAVLDMIVNANNLYVLQQDGLIHTLQVTKNGKLTTTSTAGKSDTSRVSFLMSMYSNRFYILSGSKRGGGITLIEFRLSEGGFPEYDTSVLLSDNYIFLNGTKRYCFAGTRIVFIDDYYLTVYDILSKRRYLYPGKKFRTESVRIRTKENTAFVYSSKQNSADNEDTLFVFDISDSTTITLSNQLPLSQLGDIFLYDTRLFGCGRRRNDVVVDISRPDSLFEIDSEPDTSFVGTGASSSAIEALKIDKLLFTACDGEQCIRIYDMNNADKPTYLTSLFTGGAYTRMMSDGKYLYAIKDNVSVDIFELYK